MLERDEIEHAVDVRLFPMNSPFESIADCHSVLRDAAEAAIEYWRPEPVPAAVGLGVLANALVRAERDVPDDALDRIAVCVEDALESRGSVRDSVTTGFLEAIAHRAHEVPSSVERIVRHFGPRATEYVRGWEEFTSR